MMNSSDRDFAVIWEDSIPLATQRLEIATKLEFDIHEIKDVVSITKVWICF